MLDYRLDDETEALRKTVREFAQEFKINYKLGWGRADVAAVLSRLVASAEGKSEREVRADLPVPALINFDVKPGIDLTAVERRVAAIWQELLGLEQVWGSAFDAVTLLEADREVYGPMSLQA